MFSVVMPYYKNSHVVGRSIESVINQTYGSFELIIVDDGSEDNIQEIVESYNDSRIKLVRQKNGGVAKARNSAIRLASYDWICFLDSDDEWLPYHLEHLVYLIKKYKESFYFITAHRRLGKKIFESSDLLVSFPSNGICDNLLDYIFKYGEIIHTNSICIKKELFLQLGYFEESVSIGEDTDLWYRFAMYHAPVLSKKITTLYHRDASFLTKHSKYAINWPFSNRIYMLDDPLIPNERKISMKLLLQRYQLTICKHLIANGCCSEARTLFNSILSNLFPEVRRQSRQVKILLMLPDFISSRVANYIYRTKIKNY